MSEEGRAVTNSEIKRIQLEMLDEIDGFCRQNKIRYSLAFGTLLGAVRHKGYIPWDDDVDIIMPLPDMLRFKDEFKSDKLKYCSIETEPGYEYHFSRIAYAPTYSKVGLSAKSYGVCIDLYPVAGIADSEYGVDEFLKEAQAMNLRRRSLVNWRKRVLRYLPFKNITIYDKFTRKVTDMMLFGHPYEGAGYYFHAGSVRKVNVFDYDVFEKVCDVAFEGHSYMAVGDTHRYLTHCFGDYMTPPPEDQRIPYHHYSYYWK